MIAAKTRTADKQAFSIRKPRRIADNIRLASGETMSRIAFAAFMIACVPAWADGDGERGALSRLIGEIEALSPLIEEAERQADPNDRVRFAYDWLRRDLDSMKSGIRERLERPRTEPTRVAPIFGGYRK
jgi:RAQPRD family integrative conjugative element protein